MEFNDFLSLSESIYEDAFNNTTVKEVDEYPMFVIRGVTDVEKIYWESLTGFLNNPVTAANSLPLAVILEDRLVILGRIILNLNTLCVLSTLVERDMYLMGGSTQLSKIDNNFFNNFLCQSND